MGDGLPFTTQPQILFLDFLKNLKSYSSKTIYEKIVAYVSFFVQKFEYLSLQVSKIIAFYNFSLISKYLKIAGLWFKESFKIDSTHSQLLLLKRTKSNS